MQLVEHFLALRIMRDWGTYGGWAPTRKFVGERPVPTVSLEPTRTRPAWSIDRDMHW